MTALFVAGEPASGKTTLAREAARVLGAALLDLDVVTGPLTAVLGELSGAGQDLDHLWMREHARAARYEALLDTAEDTAAVGTSVVVVAPFTAERADPDAWATVSLRFADPVLAWVDCPPELLRDRMLARAAPRDAAKIGSPARTPPRSPHVRVDATQPIAEQLVELGLGGHGRRGERCGKAPSRSTTWPLRPE